MSPESKPHSERLRELLSTQPEGEGVVILSEDECLDALDDLNALVEQLEALRKLEDALRRGWPKAVLVDRDGANEVMLAFPISDWWPVRDALVALDPNQASESAVAEGADTSGPAGIPGADSEQVEVAPGVWGTPPPGAFPASTPDAQKGGTDA